MPPLEIEYSIGDFESRAASQELVIRTHLIFSQIDIVVIGLARQKRVRQVPHTPSSHEVATITPASSRALTTRLRRSAIDDPAASRDP
jgi:hypothetical protein